MGQRLGVYVLVVVAATALLGVPAASAGGASLRAIHGADWFARLTGSSAYPSARGGLELTETSSRRTVSVKLSHAGALSGQLVTVYEGGSLVGQMRVRSDGTAHLYHDTDKGQVVPAVRLGHYAVKVRPSQGGLVASGTLHLLNAG
jgi:hypothetical protein